MKYKVSNFRIPGHSVTSRQGLITGGEQQTCVFSVSLHSTINFIDKLKFLDHKAVCSLQSLAVSINENQSWIAKCQYIFYH